jgi:hypothetical protein
VEGERLILNEHHSRSTPMRLAIITSVFILSAVALAHDGKHDEHATKSAAKPAPDKKQTTLAGEVVDLTCYLSHEGKGEKHAQCALDCIKKGGPVAILSNGVLYAVISSDHEPPNAKLASFAGKQVVVTGEQSEKNGLHFIDMDSVTLQTTQK